MLVVWIAWVVLMAGVNLPTPLYAVYSGRFGFSSAVLTAVFALYAFVLVPALMLFGRLSDRLGRRIVLLMGLAAGAAGFLYAQDDLNRIAPPDPAARSRRPSSPRSTSGWPAR